jgi:hypothetical protein
VLSTSPVFGHHLATQADALLAGYDHVANLCLIALHHLLAPVHFVFHWLLPAGVAFAVWDRWKARSGVSRTLAALDARGASPTEPIGTAAARVGLSLADVRVVDGLPNPAFTAGFWRPRVYVAAKLPDRLDAPQLEAVLAHEQAHVARRDPLRLSLLRFLAYTLFYIPALRRLAADLTDVAEIDADDAAASRVSPLVLASAILTLAEWRSEPPLPGVTPLPSGSSVGFQLLAPFQRVDLLERRIRRLAGEDAEVATHVTRRSLSAAGAVLAAVVLSGVMMVHPLPAAEAVAGQPAPHCRHEGESAFTHLFCLGWRARADGAPCPHTGR